MSRLANSIDALLLRLVVTVNPRHAVTGYLVINLAITGLALWNFDTWPNFYTIAGYWVTVTGLLVAILELYRARTVAQEIRQAVIKEGNRQRGLHYRHCLEQSKRVLANARQCIMTRQWTAGVFRLEELIDSLLHVASISPSVDNSWQTHTNSLGHWIARFQDAVNGRNYDYDREQWQHLSGSILAQLEDEMAPFNFGEELGDVVE